MKFVNTSKAPKAKGSYSQAVEHNGFLFISGQLYIDPKTDRLINGSIIEKTKQVMNNIGDILYEDGMDYTNIIKSTIYVKNHEDFNKINEVYGSYFKNGVFPAREMIQVKNLPLDADIEISVIACR